MKDRLERFFSVAILLITVPACHLLKTYDYYAFNEMLISDFQEADYTSMRLKMEGSPLVQDWDQFVKRLAPIVTERGKLLEWANLRPSRGKGYHASYLLKGGPHIYRWEYLAQFEKSEAIITIDLANGLLSVWDFKIREVEDKDAADILRARANKSLKPTAPREP